MLSKKSGAAGITLPLEVLLPTPANLVGNVCPVLEVGVAMEIRTIIILDDVNGVDRNRRFKETPFRNGVEDACGWG